MFTGLWCESLKKKRPLGDLGANGRHTEKKQYCRVWDGFIWLSSL
jgi:hypothetical protein